MGTPVRVVFAVVSLAAAQLVVPAQSIGTGGSAPAEMSRNLRSADVKALGPDATSETAPIRITSPLGRTGVAGKVRIVAQLHTATPTATMPVRFFVDGELVGTVENGPPYAVDWIDENPFEKREIVVETADAGGRTIRDRVTLPPFEVTDVAEVTSVLLETGVYDQTGRFIADLKPEAFSVAENGVAQNVDLVTREAIPATLLLLVDNSNSMSRRMDFVRHAVERLAGSLRPRDKVIVAPFNARVGALTGPTDDRRTIAEAIDAMHAEGGTAILDSLYDGATLLDGIEGRRAVILVTDGYDENSRRPVDEVLKHAEAAQVTVYIVGIGGVAGISLKGEAMLRSIADQTGGRVFFPPREPDLVPIAEAVAADAHSRYLITYTPRNQKKDGSWRAVTVTAGGDYRVRTRAGYFAPAPAPIRPTIEFTATDGERRFIDITKDDLDVIENGEPQTVETFQEAVDPVSIVMAVDASGSMKKVADDVKRAARDFVLSVRPEDSLALITFADKPLFAHVLATNRDWSLEAIDKYQPSGGTALYDALYNSLLHLRDTKGRRAVVVLTDGRDENNPGTAPGSEHTIDEVSNLLKQVGATVFAIGLGTKVDRPVLRRLADESGGDAYFPDDVTTLAEQYHLVVENLRRRYVLGYTSTDSTHDGNWREVKIVPRKPGLAVKAQPGYFAPER